jgi:hypothetical protein
VDTASYAGGLTVNNSRRVQIKDNRIARIYMTADSGVVAENNRTSWACTWCDARSIYVGSCTGVLLKGNRTYMGGSCYTRGIELAGSVKVDIVSNVVESGNGGCNWAMGTFINGGSRNISIRNNVFRMISGGEIYGIYGDNGDSIYVRNNELKAMDLNNSGRGIAFYNIAKVLEVDSNRIVDFQYEGIHSRPTEASQWKYRDNRISNVRDMGMYLEGSGGEYLRNEVNGVSVGNGVMLVGSGIKLDANRILGVKAGTGIVVSAGDNLISNNYIQCQGLGVAKGISLTENGSGSKVLFNSVNITGTDPINGRALEVLGGTNYTIKSNIFANNGGGYAVNLLC